MSRHFLTMDAVPIHSSLYESDENYVGQPSSISSDSEATDTLSNLAISDNIPNIVPAEGSCHSYSTTYPGQSSYSGCGTTTSNISSSHCPSIPYRTLNSNSSSQDSSLYSSDQDVDERWPIVSRELLFVLPNNTAHRPLWIKIAMTLQEKIEIWEMQQIAEYKNTYMDFCVIHTDHDIDKEVSQEFISHCELEGLVGTSILNNDAGENCFETAERILENSGKIFILCSPPFKQPGIHKPCYYDVLLKKILSSSSKQKLIPLTPSNNHLIEYRLEFPFISDSRPIGMKGIFGIKLGERRDVIKELRKSVLSMQIQEIGEQKRNQEKNTSTFLIKYRKDEKLKQLGKSLNDFFTKMTGVGTSEELMLVLCTNLEHMANIPGNEDEENKQVIFMDNCREISIGPAFHFNIVTN